MSNIFNSIEYFMLCYIRFLLIGSKRIRPEPTFMNNVFLTTNGFKNKDICDVINLVDCWKVHAYYSIIDAIIYKIIT